MILFSFQVPEEGDLRLADGRTTNQGRVEIYYNNQWGTVCFNYWINEDAWVVCRQLGYQNNRGDAVTGASFGPGDGPVHVNNVSCEGSESRFEECSSLSEDNSSCQDGGWDVGVRCISK